MRAAAVFALGAALTTAACGAMSPGPSGELASVLAFGAYPGATQVGEWYSVEGGPAPMPGNYGWRESRTVDDPPKIRAHYEQLARTNGWTIAPMPPKGELGAAPAQLVELFYKTRTLRVFVATAQSGGAGYSPWGNGPQPVPDMASPSPSPLLSGSPLPGATPTPAPTLPPGPWYIRLEGQVGYR